MPANSANWKTAGGSFIPPSVDVMVPQGPAYVWLVINGEGEDLAFERDGEEVWGCGDGSSPSPDMSSEDPADLESQWQILKFGFPSRDHEWLHEAVSMVGWESIFDTSFDLLPWAMENGIAPGQSFLVRIDVPHVYKSSWEYDEWDTEYTYEIIAISPLDPPEVLNRWQDILDQRGTERLLAEVKQDASALLYNRPLHWDPETDEVLEAYRKAHCKTCGGTGIIEDDATGAMGYLVNKACPDCAVQVAANILLEGLPFI